MDPSFQIIIVLYNSAKWIAPCLQAIQRSTYHNFKVCVVDNASTDDGADRVARDFPSVNLIRSPINRGFAGGNNFGVAQAPKIDLILLLNPDTEIGPRCLEELARAFDANPNLGVAGCKMFESDGATIQHVGGELKPNGLSYHVGHGEKDHGQYRGLRRSSYVQGAAMAVRREVWDKLNGLDERFNPAYYEESDFCLRARRAGWQVAVVCEAEMIHHQGGLSQEISPSFLQLYFRGRAKFLLKHYRPWDWITRYLPAEARWLLSKDSKGYRRVALRTLWEQMTGGTKF